MMHFLDIVVRLVLVIASIISYGPQVSRIKNDGTCAGISVFYLLFNLIVATFNLALMLCAMIDWEGDFLVQQPPGILDWLNAVQFAVAWLGQLVLFYLALTLPPHRPAQTRTSVIAYLSFLAISLVPAIGLAFIPSEDREWPSALLIGSLLFLVGPIVQILGVAAFRCQLCEFRSRGSVGSLSVQGLVLQAVVFFLVGISFIFRLSLPSEMIDEHFIVNLREWYWTVGWATVNNLVFSLAQGILAWIISRHGTGDDGERDALLA